MNSIQYFELVLFWITIVVVVLGVVAGLVALIAPNINSFLGWIDKNHDYEKDE